MEFVGSGKRSNSDFDQGLETDVSIKVKLLRLSREIKDIDKNSGDLGFVANDVSLDGDIEVTPIQSSLTVSCSGLKGHHR